MAELAVLAILGGMLAFAALLSGIFEEIAARQAIIKEEERKRKEAAERRERIRRRKAKEIAETRNAGHRAWGGYVGGQNIQY